MRTITVLRGLPGSGKTTLAKRLIDHSSGMVIRVNKDAIREMLHFGGIILRNERLVDLIEHRSVHSALSSGYDVIIDDTHLTQMEIYRWKRLGELFDARLVVKEIEADLSTAIKQDRERGATGGRSWGSFMIVFMAIRRRLFGNFRWLKV